ncbi:hypothetical protein MLD38_020516 [Melastoma candidum]|uniref:Uncharacterized protein n=1 Tax=Melastoma candidum TaxID=119954 RepID=A0ACB9QD92_9MYRT|nr:hypothetical protein MLD38_020516 [Melastoma candidum]
MDRYGGSQEEPPRRDPSSDAGIEEPMRRRDLGRESKPYPSRPDEADCIYYLRTGYCGYGARCRFNHPPDRALVLGTERSGAVQYPERIGQPICLYYMRTGSCKFGTSCKFHHPKQAIGPSAPETLNYHGYPLRPGAKECAYYMKTGQCKFGATCKFNHPQPAGMPIPTPVAQSQITPVHATMVPSAVYPHVQSQSIHPSQQYPFVVPRASLYSSYGPVTYGPVMFPPGMVPYPGWSPYQVVTSPSSQPSSASTSAYGPTQYPQSGSAITGTIQPSISSSGTSSGVQQEPLLPERPGQPDCQHYLRRGYCKYGSSCRYHHPSDVAACEAVVILSPVGLPLRPDAPVCSHYAQHGICRYGQACRFHHPMGTLSYSPSASSLSDIPVAPYPIGSSTGTLAPSSSSSELRIGSIIWRTDAKSSQSTGSGSVQAK